MANNNKAIGVFDSGLGGLTVVKELIKQLPNENIVYFGDTEHVPYGTKSKETVIKFSKNNAKLLLKYKVKMIVVACNTSSSFALSALKKNLSVPVIGVISPGAKEAVSRTKSKRVGVIATPATVNSQSYTKSIKTHGRSVKVFSQSCPLFVPLAEEGRFNGSVTKKIAQEYLNPLKRKNIDTLILGCTHYPLLKSMIKNVMGKSTTLVDSASAVARETLEVLKEENLLRTLKSKGKHTFIVSDQPQHFRKIAKRFLGRDIRKIERCLSV